MTREENMAVRKTMARVRSLIDLCAPTIPGLVYAESLLDRVYFGIVSKTDYKREKVARDLNFSKFLLGGQTMSFVGNSRRFANKHESLIVRELSIYECKNIYNVASRTNATTVNFISILYPTNLAYLNALINSYRYNSAENAGSFLRNHVIHSNTSNTLLVKNYIFSTSELRYPISVIFSQPYEEYIALKEAWQKELLRR